MFFSPKGPFGPADVELDGVRQERCFYADDGAEGWIVVPYDGNLHKGMPAFDFNGSRCVKLHGNVKIVFSQEWLSDILTEEEKREVVKLDNEWLMAAYNAATPEDAYLAELARERDRPEKTFGVVYAARKAKEQAV